MTGRKRITPRDEKHARQLQRARDYNKKKRQTMVARNRVRRFERRGLHNPDGMPLNAAECISFVEQHCADWRGNANYRGIFWSPLVTKHYLGALMASQGPHCAKTGVQFRRPLPHEVKIRACGQIADFPFTISLDRIDSNKGYEPGNLRFVLNWTNKALGVWGDAIFDEIVDGIITNRPQKKRAPRKSRRPTDIIDIEELLAATPPTVH